MSNRLAPPLTPAQALQQLRDKGPAWWRQWHADEIACACDAAKPLDGCDAAEVDCWRALTSLMREQADALAYLGEAYAGFVEAGRPDDAGAAVHRALVIAVLDTSAMDRVVDWLQRWDHWAAQAPPPAPDDDFWQRLAPLAAVALGGQGHGRDEAAVQSLMDDFRRIRPKLSPDEGLMAAQLVIEHQFTVQRFEVFDLLANAVELPARFDAAAPLTRARWLFTYGYSQHHTARPVQAEQAWQRALAIALAHGLGALALKVTLALARGQLNQGRVDEAQAAIDGIQAQWGAGRTAQLVELLQLRARVQLLRGRAASALSLLEDALRTAEAAALPRSETAACWSDLVQTQVALGRVEEAERLLERQGREEGGRSAQVSHCQALLLRAMRLVHEDPVSSRQALAAALELAQQTRYTMFFRLLPEVAARLCSLALRWDIAPHFAAELVRARTLLAPPDAGVEWPWPLWLRLLGGFEMRHHGVVQVQSGKVPQKPLELLRLLACQRKLSIALPAAMDALWPDADGSAARKSFDVAVHRLRPLLGDATLLWVSDGQVGLDAHRVNADLQIRRGLIDRLEALAMAKPGDAVGTEASVAECLPLVERVVALSRGELLPNMAGTPWLQAERQRCRADTVRAALAAAAVLQHAGSGAAECELLETALRIEPLAESLVARLMQAYDRAARRGDALRVFETCRRHLGERGAMPGDRLVALWRRVVAGDGR